MKKIVLILLVVMMAVGMTFAGSATIDYDGDGKIEFGTWDLHPYGGKGKLVYRNHKYVIKWDNGTESPVADHVAEAWIEMM